MHDLNPQIDAYFAEGCGRCPLGGTPECKVHLWPAPMAQLRSILLDCGLTEELKWSVPCYTHQQRNILILAAFKEYCGLNFFKGALLQDAHGLLVSPGENSQTARYLKFTAVQDVIALEPIIKAYVFEAIQNERAGLKVDFKQKNALVFPPEFEEQLALNPALKAAFEALTPGRQRAYNLHFSAPKQSKTRAARIEKCIPQILEGKSFDGR